MASARFPATLVRQPAKKEGCHHPPPPHPAPWGRLPWVWAALRTRPVSSHLTHGAAVPPRSSRRFARNTHRREKQWLLFANLNADKLTRGKPQRRRLATALQVEATALNLTHMLRMNLVGHQRGHAQARRDLGCRDGAEVALLPVPLGRQCAVPTPYPSPLYTPAEWSLHAHNYAPPHALPSELSS